MGQAVKRTDLKTKPSLLGSCIKEEAQTGLEEDKPSVLSFDP